LTTGRPPFVHPPPSSTTLKMRPLSSLSSSCSSACFILSFLAAQASAGYFLIDEPALKREWSNNAANLISWQKGVLDGINGFDVEMARMSTDGLMLVARNVPAKQGRLNIMLQDVPPGDDYFLIFINSTHGVMHATSNRFTILSPSATPSATPPQVAPNVPTVTISGGPNPTMPFATTFAAIANGAVGGLAAMAGLRGVHMAAWIWVVLGWVFGAVWTLGL